MSTASRRTKWHPTPPSPKIIHFPRSRRTRRKRPKPTHHHSNNPLLLMHQKCLSYKGKLENLFDQENDEPPMINGTLLSWLNSNSAAERRERVEEEGFGECNNGGGGGGFEEEKWRFQAEILRAECNFLRIEREFALKKLERNRVKMERTLRSAVQTLLSGREKIFEGKNVNAVLDEEIEDLAEKLEELQKTSRLKDYEVKKCSNFDKKACLLQRRLEKLGGLPDESSMKELQQHEHAESSSSINMNRDIVKVSSLSNHKTESMSNEVDMLRKKMEGLSKGMLDRVEEECGSMISSSVASSASTSKRIECPEISNFSTRQFNQEPVLHEENKCLGRCKAVIRRIVEQVRAETEQWSQMQQMLGQVRGEMEQMQASRDFWENRAHNSDYEIQSLKHDVAKWKERALDYEIKANQLQLELSVFKGDIRKSKADLKHGENRNLKQIPDLPPVPLRKQIEHEKIVSDFPLKEKGMDELNTENKNEEIRTPTKDLQPPISLAKQLAKEKRMFYHHRSKENLEKGLLADGRRKPHSNSSIGVVSPRRSPLRDIVNSSSPALRARQNSRVASPYDSPECSTAARERTRKREQKTSF
ncbi:hypothetical protein BUALT_Bualt02G0183100 [Buddleja alternifolia]|uniref:Uncharacterized protein n=1 Tax=Buddleja alternifolia TaxID=168488 RepID=A0AAV6Y7F2_9LAMI|nr:hypothetical protein BUALT_Bualt02G0183100 [Buddleja alternifolia]